MKKICLITVAVFLAAAAFSGCSGTPAAESKSSQAENQQTQPAVTENETQPESGGEPEKEDPAQSGNLIEPEQLLSADEAAQLIGEEVKIGEQNEQEAVGLKLIMYEAADENSFKFLQISVTQQAFLPDNSQTPETIYQSIIAAFDGGEKVDGIGDAAVFATPGIHIMASGYYISIGAGNSDDEAVRGILRQAGTLAVENLGKLIN